MASRCFSSTLSTDLPRARDWYISLFGFQVVFDSDWFVHLQDPEHELLEIGLIARDHEIVTDAMAKQPTGGLITLLVDDVDEVHRAATEAGVEILEPPRNLFYGQRRMLILDPDGQIVDVSSECPPDPAWLATLGEEQSDSGTA